MGIDPRNHRLGHGNRPFVAAQRSIVVSSTTADSFSTSGIQIPRTDSNNDKDKNGRNDEDDEDVDHVVVVVQSRDASSELNLDLTIRVPSPANGGAVGFEEPNPNLSGDYLENQSFPTLPLFT